MSKANRIMRLFFEIMSNDPNGRILGPREIEAEVSAILAEPEEVEVEGVKFVVGEYVAVVNGRRVIVSAEDDGQWFYGVYENDEQSNAGFVEAGDIGGDAVGEYENDEQSNAGFVATLPAALLAASRAVKEGK